MKGCPFPVILVITIVLKLSVNSMVLTGKTVSLIDFAALKEVHCSILLFVS